MRKHRLWVKVNLRRTNLWSKLIRLENRLVLNPWMMFNSLLIPSMNSVQRKRRDLLRKKKREDLQKKSNRATKLVELLQKKRKLRPKIREKMLNKLHNQNHLLKMMMMISKRGRKDTLNLILMIQLKFSKNSMPDVKRDWITKTLLVTQPSKRNPISKLKSRSKKDKRGKREFSGKEWLKFFQTKDCQFGVPLIKL